MNDDLFDKYPNHTGIAMLLFVMFFAGLIALSGELGIIGTLICIAIVIGCWCGIAHLWDKIKKDMTEKRIAKNYERGNYYDTFEHTKQSLMQNKNITDYLKLGYMYENGYGTTKDYDKAMKCYEKANAWREIGYMHYFGYGVYKDKDRANEYFAKCDDRKDCKEVISYFERIANNSNDANALYNLGWHYTEGKGISQDYQKALHYYKKSSGFRG